MAKKPFAGCAVAFKGRKETMEEIFGSKDITPMEMTKALWAYVKKHGLGKKS